ncbi:MAG TPA: SDR family oxidoreductase [Pyrinomonadaceae bacterium]|jgi:short-subunit dehydrogenase|nr:SDR family oxidoreductase [Pyrinomonadaceae bacterium]
MTDIADKKWAFITGASSGIGKALAFQFAAAGFDLFLTALEQEQLDEVAAECRDKFGIETETVAADLSDIEAIDKLAAEVAARRFTVLVNNAGFAIHGRFVETVTEKEMMMLDLQLTAMLKLTKAALPAMLEQKRGYILNVASVYSFSPVKKQAVYSACKSFIFSFSTALRSELKDTGVSVTVLCPGVVQTEFRVRAGIEDKKNSGMAAKDVARIAYDGTMRGTHIVIPGFVNKLFVFFSRHLPYKMQTALINYINARRGVNK